MIILQIVLLIGGAGWGLLNAEGPIALTEMSNISLSLSTSKQCGSSNTKNVSVPTEGGTHFGLEFRLPFMDMAMDHELNLYIVQEPVTQQLFVLHGNELYQLVLNREQKRMTLIGLLTGGADETEMLGAEIITWHNDLLLAVAMEEHVVVFQISTATVQERMAAGMDVAAFGKIDTPHFESIQQLTLPGKYHRHFLVEPIKDQVVLIVAVNYTKMQSKLRTFEWSETYFDPIEELSIPPISVLALIGTVPKYLVVGRVMKHQSKTILNIYEVNEPEWTLVLRQTLTVASRSVHVFSFHAKNYVLACGLNQAKCQKFRMSKGQFELTKQRGAQTLAFSVLRAGTHFVVGARQNEVRVFVNARLNCYGGFSTNISEVPAIFTYVNELGEGYILMSYKRDFNTLLRMVELQAERGAVLSAAVANSIDDGDEPSAQHQHQHQFEDSVGLLRSLLLRRKPIMDMLRQVSGVLVPKLASVKLEKLVRIQIGNIGVIKLVGRTLRSPVQLLQRIAELKQIEQKGRFVRSMPATATDDASLVLNVLSHLKVQRLWVGNLIYSGTIFPGFHLDNTTNLLPILSIRPKVITKRLHTALLATNVAPKRQQPQQGGITRAHRLDVKCINGVSWLVLYDSFFLKQRDSKLIGRLTLRADTVVTMLRARLLSDLPVERLFNLKHPQVVHSNLLISAYLVSDLLTERLNGLDFTLDIVFRNTGVLVEGPVVLYQAHIAGDIFLEDGVKIGREADDLEFQHFYTGRVVINGSLTLNSLLREAEQAQVLVSGIPLDTRLLREKYLLRNSAQSILQPVVFGNAKIRVPNLTSNYLNDQSTAEHLLNVAEPLIHNVPLLVFMAARVDGEVQTTGNSSRLYELSQDVVRDGEVANITGNKCLSAPLEVDNLLTLELNGILAGELVLKSQLKSGYKFKGIKTLASVSVSGVAMVQQALFVTYLNNFASAELLNNDFHFANLTLPYTLQASNIEFKRINGRLFDEIFSRLHMRQNILMMHKNLTIDGNAYFVEPLTVEHMNELQWDAYVQSLVPANADNTLVEGRKRFLSELSVTRELRAPLLNNANMSAVFDHLLLKSQPQKITGIYTFGSLQVANADVTIINGVPASAFIDIRSPEIVIEGDMHMLRLTVHGNAQGRFTHPFDWNTLERRTAQLTEQYWRSVMVFGNVSWPSQELEALATWQHHLKYLQRNAVLRIGNQTIMGNVRLWRPVVATMLSPVTSSIAREFAYVAQDALLKESIGDIQVVQGKKHFLKLLHMPRLVAGTLLTMNLLNGIDVVRLNASLYRRSIAAPIVGPLHFQMPLAVRSLFMGDGMVNGLRPSRFFQANPATELPAVVLCDMIISYNLQIGDINGIDLAELLAQRVRRHGAPQELHGTLIFERLALKGDTLLETINGIAIDNLVLKHSHQLQTISGAKWFDGDLVLTGPAHVLQLNGQQLINAYQRSVLSDGNYQFEHVLVDYATFEGGLVMSPSDSNPWLRLVASSSEQESMVSDDSQLKELYLDYDLDMQVLWQAPNTTTPAFSHQFLYEVMRSSHCERLLLNVQWSPPAKRIFLRNITSGVVMSQTHDLAARAENYCLPKRGKVRSKIKISSGRLSRVFGMKKSIESVQIYAASVRKVYVLLHAVDKEGDRHEVRVLQADLTTNELNDWQSITSGVGAGPATVQLIQSPDCNETFLAVAGALAGHAALSMYIFDAMTQRFTLSQTLKGDYNLLAMTVMPDGKQQLLVGGAKDPSIMVYERNTSSSVHTFHITQVLELSTIVDKAFMFALDDGSWHLLLLSANEEDYYHIYRNAGTHGWQHIIRGYFHNIHAAKTLLRGKQLMLLLCGSKRQCGVVKVHERH